jgi:V/A-type H+-transporting ATPase subunit K
MSIEQKKSTLHNVMKFFMVSLMVMAGIMATTSAVTAQTETTNSQQVTTQRDSTVLAAVFIAGGIAFGLAALGAGIAVGNASSAAIGAISEKPSMFGQALIFIALGEGIMIIGFAMFFIMLGSV